MKARKVALCCVLCCVGTVLMTASKTSLLYLWTLKSSSPLPQWYAAMTLVLLVPEVTSLLQTVWRTNFLVAGTMRHWPPFPIIVMGLAIALLETCVMTFFTLEVASSVPPYVVLPVMHALLLLQILLDQSQSAKEHLQTEERRTSQPGPPETTGQARSFKGSTCGAWISSMLAVLALGLTLGLGVMMALWEVAPLPRSLALPVCLMALSFTWCRPIRQRVYCASSSLPTRHNVRLMLGVVRVGLFLALSLLVPAAAGYQPLDSLPSVLWTGLRLMPDTPDVLWALVTHCLSSTASCLWGRLGAYYDLPGVSLALPAAVSTVMAAALSLLHCSPLMTLFRGLCDVTSLHLVAFGMAGCVWLLPLLALRKAYFRRASLLFRPEEDSFLSLSFSSVCLDQNLFLDYSPRSLTRGHQPGPAAEGARPKTRVFMCTTMYREADYEMEKLLKSLAAVSKSQKIKDTNVYIESHIFLDNGAQGFMLKEFALQLMSLVESCLSVSRRDSVVHKSPYGIQIRCVLDGGMPLFLHFKDNSLVKAKKRWSQAMYMKYILRHRINRTNTSASGSGGQGTGRRPVTSRGTGEILLQVRTLLQDLAPSSSYSDMSEYTLSPDIRLARRFNGGANVHHIHVPKTRTASLKQELDADRDSGHSQSSSLFSADFDHSVDNPAYVSDDEREDTPRMQRPARTNEFQGTVPTISLYPPTDASSNCAGGTSTRPSVFSISADESNLQSSCSSASDMPQEEAAGEVQHDANTYILATDADMLFTDKAVLELVAMGNEDLCLGAVCGRTRPINTRRNPLIWYQIIEFARAFWSRAGQNAIGSVMCCSGCFSLYRVQAIEQVLHQYSEPVLSGTDIFIKDTGEDCWMCTLMMLRGWRLGCCLRAVNSTYCPKELPELFKQRRRWMLSDLANSFILFRAMPRLIRTNPRFTLVHCAWVVHNFLLGVLAPGSTVFILTVGLELLMGAPSILTSPLLVLGSLMYGAACLALTPQMTDRVTKALALLLGLTSAAIVVSIAIVVLSDLIDAAKGKGFLSVEDCVFLLLTLTVLYGGLLHPRECHLMLYGFVSLVLLPTMYLLLPLYTICNVVDQSWGTRDGQIPKVPKWIRFLKIRRKQKKKNKKTSKHINCVNIGEEQTQPLDAEEQRFWRHLVASIVGKGVNTGLSTEQLAERLRQLRVKAVAVMGLANILWISMLVTIYMWSASQGHRASSGLQIGAYTVFCCVVYGYSILVQTVGMTMHQLQDGLHRLGKATLGTQQPRYQHHAV